MLVERIKKIFRKKKTLKYTEEMQKEDELWHDEKEDVLIMEKLFGQIIENARELGFKEHILIYQGPGECICDIYESERDIEEEVEPVFSFGFCKPLIETIEQYYINA